MPEIFVLFDKPNAVYAAGQKISGRVVFSTASQQNPRWIDVQLHGRSHTFFTRQESETKTNSKGESETKTHTVHYTATAKHLDTAVPLWRKTDKAARLLPGKYEWQFWFQLPCSVLPPSFEGNNGNIRYWVRAEVSRSWKFNIVDESSFEIAPFLDLNTMPIARTPLDGFAVKNLGCCCFRNGNVEA
ncbi:Arrestin-like N-terminal domain-containing protein [Caenorhabditis elegans]|uniref:Arrestin-like N-terminal domain-containing protein n=1 Tax=Caenorhabditis elegans TaxID=6239 RepID=A0A131MCQ1_CAEEL|nr:Arrestin-like N-terminal domain-containing protein [Caenorhabditis elegans]CZR14492.1 Arrestin-like N-terminal domain-containing protein [Caenorhabditis elegans]|eukprot:NP_001309576.1 ARRestin Domain protein [Caenorhabditis elegans]